MGKFKKPKLNTGTLIKPHDDAGLPPEQSKPLFSFERIQASYPLQHCTKDEKASLVDKLYQLSQLSWAEIKQQNRHKLGFEKISQDSIKTGIPAFITPDVCLIAFRFSGLKPMVGYRHEQVFYILWLDREFKLYDHG